ncbi:hypothetical protein ACH4E5_15610 [Streptomyces afghaniensis]|uniref:hypothetical protein n=1 Tax=Streptomyces afghaniensis TaxID=66865 RepID=UPI00378F3405
MRKISKEASLVQRLTQEGGVVEICVESTTLQDWRAVISGLRASGYLMKYSLDGEQAVLDLSEDTFGKSFDSVHSLEVYVGSQVWVTDFVEVSLIDFQCSPRLISNHAEIQHMSQFMRTIAASVHKVVVCAPESVHPGKGIPYAWVDEDGVFTVR